MCEEIATYAGETMKTTNAAEMTTLNKITDKTIFVAYMKK